MDLSIIIPTTQERDVIFQETLINALKAIQLLKAEILVISDSGGYVPVIPLNATHVIVLQNPGKGVASARNYGVKHASGKLLLFLDNDIIISAESVKHILNVHQQLPNACLNPDWIYPANLLQAINKSNFGKFISRHNMISYRGWHGEEGWQSDKLFASKSVASFHLSLSKQNFEKSGGYNTIFSYAGAEDYDFPIRLKAAGLVCYIDSRLTVLHNEADKAMSAANRLHALKIRAATRKTAVDLGFKELTLNYSPMKAACLNILSFFSNPLIRLLNTMPGNELFYNLYAPIYNVLEAVYIFKGYTKGVK